MTGPGGQADGQPPGGDVVELRRPWASAAAMPSLISRSYSCRSRSLTLVDTRASGRACWAAGRGLAAVL